MQPSLARNLETFSTDRDLTDWVHPAGVHNHTWVGVRLSSLPNRDPCTIAASFLSPIGLCGAESGVPVEARFGDRPGFLYRSAANVSVHRGLKALARLIGQEKPL